ncbi:hypothetical protein [Rubellicoccus peritrichatus]|uniref:Uncharacterized protein n=1 Tax=Rubellicoccus peritrichatus TaxID=3080537 RepID=A0AAQ3QXX9_9BACT|nr:hypothetical protein [Puniceicoccus sp. CR14]WOO43517.1 hypothetical protein RZN69_10500 [Puniceicoccus sp. CR14]
MAIYRSSRKTTPKVQSGTVQKKNRHAPTRRNSLGIGIEKPAQGYRHVLSKDDVWKFLRLIPDWKRVSTDLDLIFLHSGYDDADGWYEYPHQPSIALCAWGEGLREDYNPEHYRLHAAVFSRLGVEIEEIDHGVAAQFDEESAKAYQLLHILLHELGHHHYRITIGRGKSAGSESYAEKYALKLEKQIWNRYQKAFNFYPKVVKPLI